MDSSPSQRHRDVPKWKRNYHLTESEESETNSTTIGLDIAQSVFQVHGSDKNGKVIIRKQLKRNQVLAYFANLPASLIGLEACSGAHYWGLELNKLGHDARLISPQSRNSGAYYAGRKCKHSAQCLSVIAPYEWWFLPRRTRWFPLKAPTILSTKRDN